MLLLHRQLQRRLEAICAAEARGLRLHCVAGNTAGLGLHGIAGETGGLGLQGRDEGGPGGRVRKRAAGRLGGEVGLLVARWLGEHHLAVTGRLRLEGVVVARRLRHDAVGRLCVYETGLLWVD